MTDEERNEQNEERDDEERDEDESQDSEGSSADDSDDADDSGDSGDDSGDSGDEESSSSSDDEGDDDDAADESGDEDSGDDESGDDESGGGDSASTVGDIMTKDPQTVEPGDSIEDAAAKMKESDAGAMLVVDGDDLKGILTDRDVSNAVGEGKSDAKVEDIASTDPATVEPDASLGDAIQLMRENDVRRLPVVEDGKLVGVVSLGDLASAADDDSALKDISEADPNA
jgi:CBS domain-containing protein